ncbi:MULTISPECIES: disulfide bond formation protein DsbB [unclassified Achromobacter]|uniref:disulfide bond formation protein DsbB n=1 Tax=unclassified Achromobacter TaxID=2626865 RepID=UPI000B516C9F|nr:MULTISPECIES: disulfide bond formation protein DsbB [unclassified Achromobacter]OWT75301.1 disulfide bond formation protein DsbB [Achromobacter sp. HZ28]OWT75960.1 disulfide bond formation protein DsbB [Achromobacter sp. HZ34]
MMNFAMRPPRPASIAFNALALLAICAVLCTSLVWEFGHGYPPDAAVQLQRLAYLMAGAGVLLNLRFGPSPAHYAMTLAAALGGIAASGLHVLPRLVASVVPAGGVAAMASIPAAADSVTLLGLHPATWSLAGFTALLAWCTFMLVVDRRATDSAMPRRVGWLTALPMWLFFFAALALAAATALQCGVSTCPAPGHGYTWLPPEWQPTPPVPDPLPAPPAATPQ